MKRYSVIFSLPHYSDLAKDFDDKSEAIRYWQENNGGKWHNGGVRDNTLTGYKWIS